MLEEPEDVLELDVEAPEIEEEEQAEEPEVSFGEEEEEEDAPDLPKRLRGEIKERDRKLVQLEREVEDLRKKTAPILEDPGENPPEYGMGDAWDYDEEKYAAAVKEWSQKQVKFALQKQNEVTDNDLIEEARNDVQNYQQGVAALPYADAKDIVQAVASTLPESVQYTIAAVAKDPATLTYALGKHPQKLKAILDIKNPTKQIAEIVRMEAALTVKTGRKPPEPDRPLKGNAGAAVKPDKELERLEKEAVRTGDRTALIRYRKSLEKA